MTERRWGWPPDDRLNTSPPPYPWSPLLPHPPPPRPHHHAALPASQTWPPVPLSEAPLGGGTVCHLADEHPQPVRLLPEEWAHWQTLHQPQQVSRLLWHQLVSQIHEWPGFLWDLGPPAIPGRIQRQERLLRPVRWAQGGHPPRGPQTAGLQPGAGRDRPENLQEGHGQAALWPHPGDVQDRVRPDQRWRASADPRSGGRVVGPCALPLSEAAGPRGPQICRDQRLRQLPAQEPQGHRENAAAHDLGVQPRTTCTTGTVSVWTFVNVPCLTKSWRVLLLRSVFHFLSTDVWLSQSLKKILHLDKEASVSWSVAPGVFSAVDKAPGLFYKAEESIFSKQARALARKAPSKLQGGKPSCSFLFYRSETSHYTLPKLQATSRLHAPLSGARIFLCLE